jgi:hypothetical protein
VLTESKSEEEDSMEEGEGEGGEEQKSPEKGKTGPPGSVGGDTTPSKKGTDGAAGKQPFLKRAADVEMSEASGNESSRAKKTKVNPNLKRPGSPDISGASGNESSRKKQKLGANVKVAQNRQVSALRGTAGSGSESESSKLAKNKSRSGSAKATPSGSRAQSPAGLATGSGPGSRSASPARKFSFFPPVVAMVVVVVRRHAFANVLQRQQQIWVFLPKRRLWQRFQQQESLSKISWPSSQVVWGAIRSRTLRNWCEILQTSIGRHR